MAGSENKKKLLENGESSKSRIRLKILGQDGILVRFAVKRNVPLQKRLMRYSKNKKFDYRAMNFLYDGSRVLVRRTPDELHVEDEDVIEAMVHVDGEGDN